MEEKSILVIEDEEQLRDILTNKLKEAGYRVFSEPDGLLGLNRALVERPDLILLDLKMPVMGGQEMLESLRKHEWGKSVSVIILTNSPEIQEVNNALKHGVYRYYVKADWKLNELLEKIQEELHK